MNKILIIQTINEHNAGSYNKEYSKIEISKISASATLMSFYFIEYSFERLKL